MGEIFYKVVSAENSGRLVSAFRSITRVVYAVGIKTFPKILNSSLFVYDTYEHTARYSKYSPKLYATYMCTGTRSAIQPTVLPHITESVELYQKFWNLCVTGAKNFEDLSDCAYWAVPKGTVFLDDCTLLERV